MEKKILILSNCYAEQLKYYLNCINFIKEEYNINIIITYEIIKNNKFNNFQIDLLKNCDILICNNVKKYEFLTNKYIKENYLKEKCKIICFEFFRFNFIFSQVNISNVESFDKYIINTNNYNDYINTKLDDNLIKKQFENELIKLKKLDENSDIKFYDFFIQNYKYKLLFRDPYHMTDFALKYLVKEIVKKIDITNYSELEINNINEFYTYGFKFRYNLILEQVKNVLELNYNNNVNYFNINITEKDFYSILKKNQNNQNMIDMLKNLEEETKKYIN